MGCLGNSLLSREPKNEIKGQSQGEHGKDGGPALDRPDMLGMVSLALALDFTRGLP